MDKHELDARTSLFAGMVGCCHNLYLWHYDCGFHLIDSNCPQERELNNLFSINGPNSLSRLPMEDTAPTLLTNDVGMMWMAQPLMEDEELIRLFVLGPFFINDMASKAIEKKLGELNVTDALRRAIREFLEPKLIGKGLGIAPVLMLLAIYAGFRLFGVSGLIKGPLALIIIHELMKSDGI